MKADDSRWRMPPRAPATSGTDGATPQLGTLPHSARAFFRGEGLGIEIDRQGKPWGGAAVGDGLIQANRESRTSLSSPKRGTAKSYPRFRAGKQGWRILRRHLGASSAQRGPTGFRLYVSGRTERDPARNSSRLGGRPMVSRSVARGGDRGRSGQWRGRTRAAFRRCR